MPPVTMYHPTMQEGLIAAAGSRRRRGPPRRQGQGCAPGQAAGGRHRTRRRYRNAQRAIVVGADGRNSMVRKWGGFEVREEQAGNMLAGVLLDNVKM